MLLDAILLDAAMPVGAALRRLAQHGFWLDPTAPEARQWLEEAAARMRETAAPRDAAGGGEPPPPPAAAADGRPRLDPRTATADDAARLLARPLEAARVVIRRQEGVTLFWYTRRIEHVLSLLESRGGVGTVAEALDLHEYTSDQAEQAAALDAAAAERFVGVVLHGMAPIAVGEAALEDLGEYLGLGTRSAGSLEGPAATNATRAPAIEVRAFPLLEAPQTVAVGVPFALAIGLAAAPVAGVLATRELVLRATAGTTVIPVDVQVTAEGFDALAGWKHTLEVEVSEPTKARVVARLVARPQDEPVRLTALIVSFSVGGALCGSAARHVIVERTAGMAPPADDRGKWWLDAEPGPGSLTLDDAAAAPDIEVDIVKPDGNAAKGTYQCVLRNAHGVPIPDGSFTIELGDDAKTFAKNLIDEIRVWSDDPLVDNALVSKGTTVAGKLPPQFWAMLRAVADEVKGRPLTLLLNSAEPYVPWELALVEPPLEPDKPNYLAAQVVMGRWIHGDREVASPPRRALTVKAMALMAGMYGPSSGLPELPEALTEVKTLAATYAAMPALALDCSAANLKALLDASLMNGVDRVGGVDAVHFAGHGEVNPARPGDAALYLNNGRALSPTFFRACALGKERGPFLFLNACMVGTGGEMLGDYGGFPGNCLVGGFSGLVAPLWAVNDKVARAFALEFYRQALSAGGSRPVAEVLRDLRAKYRREQPISTYLAYVYYGNPSLTLTRAGSAGTEPIS